jgi:hypothetical protein
MYHNLRMEKRPLTQQERALTLIDQRGMMRLSVSISASTRRWTSTTPLPKLPSACRAA